MLVAHPGRQHAHRLARALADANLLQGFWTMLPDRRALRWWPLLLDGWLPSAVWRNSLLLLPREKVHCLLGPLIVQKAMSKIGHGRLRAMADWFAWVTFDWWVARRIRRLRPRVIVGYEMCCQRTFRVAKSLGIVCVLDAAACHHQLQERVVAQEGQVRDGFWAKRLRSRKQCELTLADHVTCVSELAARSYVDAGIEASKITVNAVGCDVAAFSAAAAMRRAGPVKFIFAGVAAQHKGFDVLLSGFSEVLRRFPDSELHVAGDAAAAARYTLPEQVIVHGKLSHAELARQLQSMDCLVLPSRLESFGMVVIEALAAGTPVIVSDHAGAYEAIVDGRNGWVVPTNDRAALAQRMSACCENIEGLRDMHDECRRSALAYDWSRYERRAADFFHGLIDAHRQISPDNIEQA